MARVNNTNTQEVERLNSESNVILEAIKTGTGNTDAACKNLSFLAKLGLVHDPEGKIAKECKDAPAGPPSLPANQISSQVGPVFLRGEVRDSAGSPIPQALVRVEGVGGTITTDNGEFRIELPLLYPPGSSVRVSVTKSGYEPFTNSEVAGVGVSVLILRKTH